MQITSNCHIVGFDPSTMMCRVEAAKRGAAAAREQITARLSDAINDGAHLPTQRQSRRRYQSMHRNRTPHSGLCQVITAE
jgi:hypothetical protein